jgi:hypothetical protein
MQLDMLGRGIGDLESTGPPAGRARSEVPYPVVDSITGSETGSGRLEGPRRPVQMHADDAVVCVTALTVGGVKADGAVPSAFTARVPGT